MLWGLLACHIMCSAAHFGLTDSKTARLARLLPGETLDVFIRSLALTTMYFGYRNDKQARKYTLLVWIFCLVLLFCRTIFRIVVLDSEENR